MLSVADVKNGICLCKCEDRIKRDLKIIPFLSWLLKNIFLYAFVLFYFFIHRMAYLCTLLFLPHVHCICL